MTPFYVSRLLHIVRLNAYKRLLNSGTGSGVPLVQRMSGNTMTYNLPDVVKFLGTFASPSLAESWDNVGLLVEPPSPQPIKKVLLTIDLTEDVLEETLQCGAQLVVSYHPPIFVPLKSVTSKSWKERIVGTLLEKKIALYSPHTAWDSVENGLNDWLATAFGNKETMTVQPINPHFTDGSSSHTVSGIFCSIDAAQSFKQSITTILGLTSCRIIQSEASYILEIPCTKSTMAQIIEIMSSVDNVKVVKNEKIPLPRHGSGRKVTLHSPISLQCAINAVKSHINVTDVSVAIARGKSLESPVSRIVLCAGSGASILKGLQADLYLTGEMFHHDVLNAVHEGTHVILTRHSNSERGFLKVAAQALQIAHPEMELIVSKQDRDPLMTV